MGMTAGLTLPIVGAGLAMVNAASDFEESMNAVNVIFGESDQVLHDWYETSEYASSMSQTNFNELATTGGALLQNLGFDADGAAGEMLKLTERAVDLGSVFNKDTSVALEAIQSGLKGEMDPLEQFGVKLNAAAIEAKALQMGLADATVDMYAVDAAMLKADEAALNLTKAQQNYNEVLEKYPEDSMEAQEAALKLEKAQQNQEKALRGIEEAMAGQTEELDDAAKAQATLALFYEQTDKVANDYINTQDSFANQMKQVETDISNLAKELGTMLMPYIIELMGHVRGLIDRFKELSPEQQKVILIVGGIIAILGPLLMIVGSVISAIGVIGGVISAAAGAVGLAVAPFLLIIAAIIAAVALLVVAWKNDWGGIQEKTKAVIDWLSTNIKKVIDNIKKWWDENGENIKASVKGAWEKIQSIVQGVIDYITLIYEAWSAAFDGDWYTFGQKLRAAWELLWNGIKTFVEGIWNGIKTYFETAWRDFLTGIDTVITNIKNAFTNADWGQIGKNIIQGIGDGLKNMLGWLKQTAGDVVQAVKDAFAGFLDAKSPSRLMMKFGEWSSEGYGLGMINKMNNMIPMIKHSLGKSIDQVLPPISPSVGASGGNPGFGGGITFGANSIQLNFYGAQDTSSVRKGVGLGIADALRARGTR